MPDGVPPSPVDPADEDEWNWQGAYDLAPVPASSPIEDRTPVEIPAASPSPVWRPVRTVGEPLDTPDAEPWWPPSVLYPLRAAEGWAMVASLGAVSWVMGTLAPEYCLTLLADGEKLGAPSMGRLIALISALPVAFLIPFVLIYWLRYLAVVLAASAEGEATPPRPPDRNFDGFLTGLAPWLLWLVLGAGVGLLPLAAYGVIVSQGGPWNPGVAVALGLSGMPYALMALLMIFLHDDPLAARPGAVIAAIARLGPSFLALCTTIAGAIGLVIGAFVAAFLLRAGFFLLYIPASLACWFLAAWTSITAMHTLGTFYGVQQGRLKWRRQRARWGVDWKV
jgi:hypothetical protein